MVKEMFDRFVEDKTKGLYVPRGMESVGKAYGYFDCGATKDEVEKLMPMIRKYVQTPSEVHFSLSDEEDKRQRGSQIKSLVEEATYRGATNGDAADEVAQVLIQAYQSNLYDDGEPFMGEIVFEEEGKYVFRD